MNRVTTFNFDYDGLLTSVQSPLSSTNPMTYTYQPGNVVLTASNGNATWQYAWTSAGIVTVTVTDPLGHTRVAKSTTAQPEIYSDQDGNGNTTLYSYLLTGQLQKVTLPLLNTISYTYDGRGNVTTTTVTPAPGTSGATLTTQASFDPTCQYPAKCNKPNYVIDANGNKTTYFYNDTYGVLLTVNPPVPTSGAVRPQTRYTYTPLNAWYLTSAGTTMTQGSAVQMLTGTSSCQTLAAPSCGGNPADAVVQTFGYDPGSASNSSNLALVSATTQAGNGTPTSPDTANYAMTYTKVGTLNTVQGPLGTSQTVQYFYDNDWELSGVVSPGVVVSGSTLYPALRYTYNDDGNVTQIESGTVVSQSKADFANFVGQRSLATTYDSVGRKNSDDYAGSNTGGAYVDTAFVQYGYDNANNLQCVATRMNPANFHTVSPSACTQETPGSNPPDMITAYGYDPGDRLTTVTKSSGTYSSPSSIAYETLTYTNNNLVSTLVDANNNQTYYKYDGLDRLSDKYYPSATLGAGAYDPNDYEAYT